MYSTPQSSADIDHRFGYHPPQNDATAKAHADWRVECAKLAHVLDDVLPPGREKATALTRLEDTLMWGNAAIARHNAQTAANDARGQR